MLATRQGGTVDVQTSGSTAITRSVSGTVSDLVPNATVVVSGPLTADGTYAASTIVIGALANGAGGAGGGTRNPARLPSRVPAPSAAPKPAPRAPSGPSRARRWP